MLSRNINETKKQSNTKWTTNERTNGNLISKQKNQQQNNQQQTEQQIKKQNQQHTEQQMSETTGRIIFKQTKINGQKNAQQQH